jgi:PAS domain S-box-containing protein
MSAWRGISRDGKPGDASGAGEVRSREEFVQREMEEVFRDWAYKVSLYGAVIFMLLAPLDYISRPPDFVPFLLLRLATSITLVLLGRLVLRARKPSWRRFWVALGVFLAAAVIEIQIIRFQGDLSPYYAGQILLGVVTLGFIPTSFLFHNFIVGIIQTVYFLPLLLLGDIARTGDFIIRNYFLFFILGSTVLVSHIARRQLMMRIGLEYDLKIQEQSLESLVKERTRQLSEIAEDWRVTVDSTGDAIMRVNETGRVVRANLACVHLSGIPFRKLIGADATDFLGVLGLEPAAGPMVEVLHSGAHSRAEFWSAPLKRWYQVSADPTLVGNVFLAGAVVTIRDVTDSREMQQAILAAGKDWEETFNSIHEGITIHDRDFRIRRSNAAAQRLVGGERPLAGLPCHEIFHGLDRRIVDCPGRQAQESGQTVTTEFFEPHLGRHLEVTCLPRPQGGIIHVVHDITDRKRNLEEIREAGLRLQRILERAPFGVFMVDADFIVEFANPAILSITGYPREVFVGGCLRDFPGCAELGMADHLQAALQGVPFRLGPKGFHCMDGCRRIVGHFTGIPLEEGGSRKVLVFVEDVTELRDAEEEQERLNTLLLQAQKMESIGTLASGIAHDFNNILLAVIGLSDAAMERLAADHPAREDLESVVGAAERGTRLVQQMVAFSRQQDLKMTPVQLEALVRETARLLEHILPRDVSLAVADEGPLPQVLADAVQIEQVLMNLAVNARDAMPRGGSLAIRTAAATVLERDAAHPGIPAGRYVVMAVSDTGTGMEPKIMARIFDPFFTTKDADKGTGLGLATVYGIVCQHGGGIRVESEPGHGSTFFVYLPVEGDASTGGPPVAGGAESILLVEDDPSAMEVLSRKLVELGYRVVPAANGDEALALAAKAGPIDALLCDVVIPGMEARRLMEELRGRLPRLKVVFISGHPGEYLRRRGLVGDDDLLLTKALGPVNIARRLREELDRAVV